MDAGTLSSLAVSAVALTVGLLTYRNNRAGQNATTRIEDKRIELDGKKVDLEVLTDSILNLRTDLAAERSSRQASDQRAVDAERRANRAEQRVDRLAASMAAHNQWDLLILSEVRKSSPDFPGPPPFAFLDEDL